MCSYYFKREELNCPFFGKKISPERKTFTLIKKERRNLASHLFYIFVVLPYNVSHNEESRRIHPL